MSNSYISSILIYVLISLLFVCLEAKDYYEILGVSRSATDRELKRAYRKLSHKYHPDKNPGDKQAEASFIEMSSAYEVLSNAEQRQMYDRYGEEGLKKGGQSRGGGDPFDIFSQFFGGGGRRGGFAAEERRGDDFRMDVFVTLQDLYMGKDLSVEVNNKKICHHCRGTGAKSDEHIHHCNVCGGRGVRTQRVQLGPGMYQQMSSTCDACGGTGKKVTAKCPVCEGKKVVTESTEYDIYIEKGMSDDDTIVFENAADQNPDFAAGHLVFKLQTLQHPTFQREGNDLHVSMQISLLQSLIGFENELTHLDGHSIAISKTSVTKPGEIIVVSGEGMPLKSDPSRFGDLFVKIVVDFPDELTNQQREAVMLNFN